MKSFVRTDAHGNFTLDGKPWFLHGATYFGRRPGTCGADWMGEHFEFNFSFAERDFAKMNDLGINTLGLFVPARAFFDGLRPVQERFDRLSAFLDKMGEFGLRAIVYASRALSRDAWCAEHGVDPNRAFWHAAVNPDAESYYVASATAFRSRFAHRPEVLGWATSVGRFFRYGFDVPPVRPAWAAWLRERFDGDLARARELLDLSPDEKAWDDIRMPTEMEPYFNEDNPRSFEFALMQQTLCRRATVRITGALKKVTPNQLIVEDMEGCCFSSGHLTTIVPEMVAADALWLECYHWEGLRSYHFGEGPPRWMKEPVADKPSAEVLNAAGYVEMLVRWARRSGKPVIICHGVDIGEKKRGVRSEEDQTLLIGHFNTFAVASGAHGVNYWCWTDDELSKTFTRRLGIEYTVDTPDSKKAYQQAGETMGILRYDGSERPICAYVRGLSRDMAGRPAEEPPRQVLVLFPCPAFQSLHRYRSNVTGFAIFTSLARQGILAHAAMTSAGGSLIGLDGLAPYRLVIVGAPEYTRDHPETPDLLLAYVRGGGALFLPLGRPDRLQDPYLKSRRAAALEALAGCRKFLGRDELGKLDGVRSEHSAFPAQATPSWELDMDEPATFTRVEPVEGADVLVSAAPGPLLYRHRVGRGSVYVFTWNLDVLLYRGAEVDYRGGQWDWLWQGLASELALPTEPRNAMTRLIRDMSR